MADDAAPFPYLRWAKAHLDKGDPRSLGLSGRRRPGPDEVEGLAPPWPPEGPDPWTGWRTAVARHEGLPGPEWVLPSLGTSHGNFAVAVAFARSGRIAVETPAYESLPRMGAAVSARVATFRRDPARGWRIDRADLERATEGGCNLLVVTDLHNPSGARLHSEDLDHLLAVATRHDALVLVDEVYRELDPLDRPTAARTHPRVLATNSLTKCYGLWDLRAGWIAGDPARIATIDAWEDLVVPVLPAEPLTRAAAFLAGARPHLERTRARAATATAQVDRWVGGRTDVSWTPPDAGFTGLLRLAGGASGDAVAERAWEAERLRVVPGSFFQVPDAVRISYGNEPADLDASLSALGRVLDAVP